MGDQSLRDGVIRKEDMVKGIFNKKTHLRQKFLSIKAGNKWNK
jgi:hypothetical protein